MSNRWFRLDGGSNLCSLYGERGFALLAKMMQQRSARGEYSLTDRHIQSWFGYTTYREVKKMMLVLAEFQTDGLVIFNDDYNFDNVVNEVMKFEPTTISEPDGDYFSLYDYEIDTILQSAKGCNKLKLLLLFGCLKYHYRSDTKVTHPSIELLSDETGLSQTSILAYIDTLVDLGLILYDNPGTRLYPDGNVKECNNIYTMNYKGNKAILDQAVERETQELHRQEKENKLKIINKDIGNQKRKIKAKMRWQDKWLSDGKITQGEYDIQYSALQAEYDNLIEQQKLLHKQ